VVEVYGTALEEPRDGRRPARPPPAARSCTVGAVSDSGPLRPRPVPKPAGRLTRDEAVALLIRAGELLAQGDYPAAGDHYLRVVGFDDATITGAALMGLGEVRYRLNDENAAVATWQAVIDLGETPSTYGAWRNIAAARVRDGDLRGAMDAYREADRRAPQEDKAEIANRLGWLSKETGNVGASKKYFARGRGDRPLISATVLIIAITSIVSLTALYASEGQGLYDWLQLDKPAVAAGEYWRLWTVTLLHGDILHLAFNMYALYLSGLIVERWYGSIRMIVFYLTCAAAGSTASFVFGGDVPSVGASGAIFGLFGVLLTAGRIHHPVDRESRGIVPQLAFIIVINIVFGFASGGAIDNAAHLGGLAAGMWLGALVPPTAVPTMSSLWHLPGETRAAVGRATAPAYVMAAGVAVVGVAVVAGVLVGTTARAAFVEPGMPAARVAYVSATTTWGAESTAGRGSATALSVER
jgi:membrane associated rhomboid family serine protease